MELNVKRQFLHRGDAMLKSPITCVEVIFGAALLLLGGCSPVNSQYTDNADGLLSAALTPALQITAQPLGDAEIQTLENSDHIIHAFRFSDQHGDNTAMFSRELTHEEDPTDETIIDRVSLDVLIEHPSTSQTKEAGRWQHSAEVECEGMDIEADFFPDAFSVTDVDGDGTAELTFAYHRFCGGGVDPRDVTVVLFEGENSYVLQGETLVQVGTDPAFGGEFTMDDALTAAPAWIREKVLSTFKHVRDESVTGPLD